MNDKQTIRSSPTGTDVKNFFQQSRIPIVIQIQKVYRSIGIQKEL